MSMMSFKCPCCGAELKFSPSAQKMVCEYCGTELNAEAAGELSGGPESPDSMEWEDYSGSTVRVEGDMCLYTCNSCGAEISGSRSLGASVCPYCDSPLVISGSFEGILKPDFIIPFKVDKQTAVRKLEEFCKNRPLLPGGFMNSHRIESIQGMYVPYWLFDCSASAHYRFTATRVSHWSEGDYNVTKTDHFLLVRNGSMVFDHVPVDGTSKLPAEITEAVEPFSAEGAPEFNTAYLSGFLADRYDVSAEESRRRANVRIKKSIENSFRETAAGYGGVVCETENVTLQGGRVRYALMPLWLMTARYKDKPYTFAVNGQTGRITGELPVSRGRAWLLFAGIAAVGGAVLSALLYLLGV